jgi:hypothetical protein
MCRINLLSGSVSYVEYFGQRYTYSVSPYWLKLADEYFRSALAPPLSSENKKAVSDYEAAHGFCCR